MRVEECNERDIFFLIDGGASVGPENFKRQVEFLARFVRKVDLDSRKIRLGVIEVSNKERTKVIFSFESSQNPLDIEYLLKDMPFYNKPDRYVGEALKKVYTSVFTGSDGDRPEVGDTLVILMNGRMKDAAVASEYSEKLKVRGVRIIAAAVGTETELFEDQIELMASSLQDMLRSNFDYLDQVGNHILNKICTLVPVTREPGIL
ncbi:cartilage matrix protein-like [Dendronephthya gigantea]|uniref:cartilage matrix protein-like n=1 Tax=Dendronephthya gigantea TaxID=151771 RepID=UPI001069B8D6|nr:cartilage matrix protein-like [Dendronephthya gigantea]